MERAAEHLWWAKIRNLGAASAPLAPPGAAFVPGPSACLHAGASLSLDLSIPGKLTVHQMRLHQLALHCWYSAKHAMGVVRSEQLTAEQLGLPIRSLATASLKKVCAGRQGNFGHLCLLWTT